MIYFSIIIPLYNKERYILRALESIRSQSYQNFEVIVVNDGSTDDSVHLISKWLENIEVELSSKIRLVTQKNSGVSAARNRGALESKYDYIAFLDADDFWKEGHLLNLSLLIENYYTDVDIFSNGVVFQIDGVEKTPKLSYSGDFMGIIDYFPAVMESYGYVHSSSVCVKRDALLDFLFPLDMKFSEDLVTWANISGSKGVAFSAVRTSVYVQDNAYASICRDFMDYIRFENYIMKVPYDRKILRKFVNKILLFAVFTARIQMGYTDFLRQSKKIVGKSLAISSFIVLSLLIPRSILIYLRSRRNSNKYI